MKVSELAKELKVTNEAVLSTLKSLKLKGKDADQVLSAAVVSVVKSSFKKDKTTTKEKASTTKKKTVAKKKEVAKPKKTVKKAVKKVAKKATKKAATKAETAEGEAKPTRKRVKRVVKKVVRTRVKDAGKDTKKKASATEDASKKSVVDTKKKKISKEPVFTLKPLSRKRKRPSTTDSKGAKPKEDVTQEVSDEEKIDPIEKAIKERNESAQVQGGEREGGKQVTQENWVHDKSLPDLEIEVPITVKDLSPKIQQKPSEVLKQLMKLGVFAHINQSLDGEVVSRLTQRFGVNAVRIKTQEENMVETHKQEEEDPSALKPRAPVVTFMGHVDHGKTSLIDYIRKTKIADAEHGAITQHVGAYSVKVSKGSITFLDTPGHEAFTAMRARGAHITDIVVLVVAADEGVMPQTKEAIDHARAADVPIVVALNKMDRPNANPDRVKKQLAELDLASEDWGGKTVVVGVSAMTGDGVDELLELILLEAELLELSANPDKKASGIVVEAHLSQGKGAVTTLIVQSGTLVEGDSIVVGAHYGKIRALFDDHMRPIKDAGPSTPVEILGLSDVPEAGESFYALEDERMAKDIAARRRQELKNKKLQESQKITLEDLYSQLKEGEIKELKVVLKADVQGSLEALKDSLQKIPSTKVKIKFIHSAVGEVTASDVLLAYASKAIIIAFHVGIEAQAKKEMEKEPVDVREYRIIYDAVNDMRKALEGLLERKTKKNFSARVEIREVFKLSKSGIIAGCYVAKGKVLRKANIDIVREGETIHSGTISSLKRFKDDVKEVTEGMECGIAVEGFTDYKAGDTIEVYEIESFAQSLD